MGSLHHQSIGGMEQHIQQHPHAISLAQGAMKTASIAPAIKEHVQTLLTTTVTDYYQPPAGIAALREHIAHDLGAPVTHDNVIVTHGAMGALSVLLATLLNAGDEVVLPEPSYAAYHEAIKLRGAHTVWVPLLDDRNAIISEEQFMHALEASRTPRSKVLLLANPGNPLGTVLSKTTIERLVAWAEQHEIYLVVDEVYRTYIFKGTHTRTAAHAAQNKYVVMIDSFSKSYAMSGWRIGYMVTHHSLLPRLAHTQHIMLNCANGIAQYAALYALQHPEHNKRLQQQLYKNYKLVADYVPQLAAQGLHGTLPAGGFFMTLTTDMHAHACTDHLLTQHGVGLIPGTLFGPSGHCMVRLCFARPYDQLNTALARLVGNTDVR